MSCNALVAVLFYPKIAGDFLQQAFTEFMRKHYRKTFFSCHNMLKAMDMNGGTLNHAGVEVLRGVETNGVKFSSSIIPSKGMIQKHARKAERVGSVTCPF